MDTMGGQQVGVNATYVQQTFPLWCAGMTETFSKLSRRIIQIREYLEQQNMSGACSSGVVDAPDSVLTGVAQTSASAMATSSVKKAIALITRLQSLEKEKFTLFASICLDNFRLKSNAIKEVNVGPASTTLMGAEQSLGHASKQKADLEEKISEELLELQGLKIEFAEMKH
jgi:hypothetical protein